MDNRNFTLLTDFYELTMMQGYFENHANETVVFDLFYRQNPDNGGYAVCAGLDQVIDYIKSLHFDYDDIDYLRGLGCFSEDFLNYLASFHFTGDIYAVPEGSVVFPMEPLVKVVAPIMEAQLVETAILNLINHQSLIATKAARVCYAARGGGVMEFGLRRAQGPDAGTFGARAAVIGGCIGTSNVICAKDFDVPALGTHAHSWIMSFGDEVTAFRKYAELYPQNTTLLVDTYDTLRSGVPHAIQVFKELRQQNKMPEKYGIRLDSGDLAYLSKKARKMLDDAGFTDAGICASSDLDEYLIDSLLSQGACIDSWGVGTNLITSKNSNFHFLIKCFWRNSNFSCNIRLRIPLFRNNSAKFICSNQQITSILYISATIIIYNCNFLSYHYNTYILVTCQDVFSCIYNFFVLSLSYFERMCLYGYNRKKNQKPTLQQNAHESGCFC